MLAMLEAHIIKCIGERHREGVSRSEAIESFIMRQPGYLDQSELDTIRRPWLDGKIPEEEARVKINKCIAIARAKAKEFITSNNITV